jgi:hypothetical protein
VKDAVKLEKFKAVQIAKLNQAKRQYKDSERVQEIVDLYLIPKLQHLRAMDLADYIFTLYLASREFNVFEDLIPGEQEVEKLVKEKNKLYALKARYLARLMSIRKELKQKHREKAERIEEIVFIMASRLANLRSHMLTDYMFSVTLACREFTELCNLAPSEQEIKQLFEE